MKNLKAISKFLITYVNDFILIGIFLYALIFPAKSIDLIFNNGIYIFFAEILSICIAFSLPRRSPEWTWSLRYDWPSIILPLALSFASLAFFLTSERWLSGVLFLLSSLTKVFDKGNYTINKNQFLKPFSNPLFIFFLTITPCILFAQFLSLAIPFPKNLLPIEPTNIIFIDYPRSLLVWGFSYYSIILLVKAKNNLGTKETIKVV